MSDMIVIGWLASMLVLVVYIIHDLDGKPPRRERVGAFGMGQLFGREVA